MPYLVKLRTLEMLGSPQKRESEKNKGQETEWKNSISQYLSMGEILDLK